MTTSASRVHEDRESMIRGWFTNHIATVFEETFGGAQRVQWLTWRRPGTVFYRIDYLAHGHRLFVSGDVGDAVYVVSSPVDLEWWAKCDRQYFAGKCTASENGRGHEEWDEDEARDYLRQMLAEDGYGEQKAKFDICGGWRALSSKHEWHRWLEQYGYDVWRDWTDLGEIGMRVSTRCEAHLIGIQLAVKQLTGAA